MEYSIANEVSLVDSLFYLAYTEIPIRARYGDKYVLYNHKTGQKTPVDQRGYSIIEPGGVYTIEMNDSPIVKDAAIAPVKII